MWSDGQVDGCAGCGLPRWGARRYIRHSQPAHPAAQRPQVLMESVWYYVVNGAQTGPVSLAELKDAAATGKLSPPDLVWQEGTADWVPARTVAGLFPAAPPPRPMPVVPHQ